MANKAFLEKYHGKDKERLKYFFNNLENKIKIEKKR